MANIKDLCPNSGNAKHKFEIVRDEANAKVIRKMRNLTPGIPVWRCVHCGEVTESM